MDVSTSTLQRGLQTMTRNLGNAAAGTGTFAQTLSSLGLSVAELQNLSADEQFIRLADAIATIPDPAMRAATAQEVFGKAAMEMLPMLQAGEGGIKALMQQAQALGLTITTQDVTALGALDSSLKVAKDQLIGLAIQVGVAVSGPLTAFLNVMTYMGTAVIEFVRNNTILVAILGSVAATVTVLSTGLIALGTAMKLYAVAAAGAQAATAAFGVILTIVSAHPIIAVLTLIAAGIAAVAAYFWDANYAASEFSGSLDDVNKASAGGAGGVPADVAAIQAQAAQIQSQIALPTAQNVTMDQAAIAALDRMLGAAMQATARNTESAALTLTRILQRMDTGGGFIAGTG